MSNARGPHWSGDRAELDADFVADGHVIILKTESHPEAVGALSLPYQLEDHDGDVFDDRVVPQARLLALWMGIVDDAKVPGRFGDTFRSNSGSTVIEFLRADGNVAWVSAFKAAFLRGCVTWDEMKQGGSVLSAIVCYRGALAVAGVMPLRFDDYTQDDPRHVGPLTLYGTKETE